MAQTALWLAAAVVYLGAAIYAWRRSTLAEVAPPWRWIAALASLLCLAMAAGSWFLPEQAAAAGAGFAAALLLAGCVKAFAGVSRTLDARILKAEQGQVDAAKSSRLLQRALTAGQWKTFAEEALHTASNAVGCDKAFLLKLDPEESELEARLQLGWNDRPAGRRFPAEGPAAELLLGCDPAASVVLPTQEEGDTLAAYLHKHGIVSTAAVVLKGPLGLMGVLSVHSEEVRTFSDEHLRFLSDAALALYHAYRLRRGQETIKDFRRLREHGAEIVFSFDKDGKVGFVNQQGRQLLGIKGSDRDLTVKKLMPDWAFRKFMRTAVDRVRRAGIWFGEGVLLTRGEQEIPVQQVLLGHRDEQGEVVQFSAFAIDMAHNPEARAGGPSNEELKRQVRSLTSQLQEAAAEVEVFAESTGRRLQEPVGAIVSFTRSLLSNHSKNLGVQGRRYVQLIQEAARTAGQIIMQLNQAARLQRQPFKFGQVDMTSLVQSAYREAADRYPDVSVRFSQRSLFPIQGDRRQLRRAFVELLDNAFKFSQKVEAPEIEVGSQNEGGSYVYYVRDNGAGFEIEKLDRLFGLFQRLHKDKDYNGSGAGLFLVKRIIQRHGGDVWAKGAPNMGATIYVSLPATPTVEESPAES